MPIRAGRFKDDVGTAAGNAIKLDIVDKRMKQFYRIFNPGARLSSADGVDFRVEYGPTSERVVPVGSSLDFLVADDSSNPIRIAHHDPAHMGLEQVRGVYERLTQTGEQRSGRFRFDGGEFHTLIDLTASDGVSRASYRFLNSGDAQFRIFPATGTTELAVVRSGRSFDLSVSQGEQIRVRGPADKIIQGIYELLAFE